MKKTIIMMLLLIAFTSMLLANEPEKEKYIKSFQKVYEEDCNSEYAELFSFWADFIIYLNQFSETNATQDDINHFKNNCTQSDKLIYLEWSIKQKYPLESERIKSWIGIDMPYPLNENQGRQITSFTRIFNENPEDGVMKGHLLDPINLFGTIIEVGKKVPTKKSNSTFVKTPLNISIQEVLGDQYKQSTLSTEMGTVTNSQGKKIFRHYSPSVGDTVFAKVWATSDKRRTESDKELMVYTIVDIHQIQNDTIRINRKGYESGISGLKEKTSIAEYKSYWNDMFNKIITRSSN